MTDSANLHCSYCGAAQADVRKLVPGPSVFICNACVGSGFAALVGDAPSVSDRLESSGTKGGSPVYCAFCGKQPSEVKRLVGRNGVCICDECLVASLDILLEGEQPFNGPVPF